VPARTNLVTLQRPFTGGFCDDPRDPAQALTLVDGLFPLGVLCLRGGYTTRGETNPLGSGPVHYVAELIVPASGRTSADIIVADQTLGVGLATSAARKGAFNIAAPFIGSSPPAYIPLHLFNGEMLLYPQDGESPILRSAAGKVGAARTFTNAGTAWVERTGTTVTLGGLSSNLTSSDVGRFVTSRFEPGSRRLVAFQDADQGHVSSPFWISNRAGGWVSDVGRLGLLTKVTDRGTVNAPNATITGLGTLWATASPQDAGRPLYFGGSENADADFIMPIDAGDYGYTVPVNDVGGDTTITINVIPPVPADQTDIQYVIGRPLVGKVGCVHEGRLYTAGVLWAPRRLQVSPPLWNGETPTNDEFSFDVEVGRAAIVGDVELSTQGTITGLMSLPGGNLAVLTDVDAFVAWGQYPSLNFEHVGDMGNFGTLSFTSTDDVAFFAGRDGVYQFDGNRPRSITAARRGYSGIDHYWQNLLSNGFVSCTMAVHRDHLVVTLACTGVTRHLVFDIRRQVWCGNWTLPSTVSHLSASRVAGQPDRLLMASSAQNAIDDLSPAFVDHETDISVPSTNPGVLVAITGEQILGDVSMEKEVKWLKLAYQMVASAGTPTMTVKPGPAPSAAAALTPGPTVTTGEVIGSVTAYPQTTVGEASNGLGERIRRFNVRLDADQGSATVQRVVVHELQMEVKEYRPGG
jgi:hypothetical protein